MAEQTPLTNSEINHLTAQWPNLPQDYLAYLCDFGWGRTPRGRMIYSGPISPDEVYPQLSGDKQHILIGDDMQGYCLGYDFISRNYGEFSDSSNWSSFDVTFDLAKYLSDYEYLPKYLEE